MRLWLFRCIILLAVLPGGAVNPETGHIWYKLDDGLHYTAFRDNQRYSISVLRIDPAQFDFQLLCASEHSQQLRSPEEWSSAFSLHATINAGMYQQDYLTSVGYLRSGSHVNNPSLNANNCIFACQPLNSDVPQAQIIDRTCQDYPLLKQQYGSLLQGIRMISCAQRNVWAPGKDRWKIAALGADHRGNILFLYSHTRLSVNNFANYLLTLPLNLHNAMYLEGGPPAALFIIPSLLPTEVLKQQPDLTNPGQPVPNVLGIMRKQ